MTKQQPTDNCPYCGASHTAGNAYLCAKEHEREHVMPFSGSMEDKETLDMPIKQQHTPTPWASGEPFSEKVGGWDLTGIPIHATNHAKAIARVWVGATGNEFAPHPEGIANAEFIITACNAHCELVAALRFIADKTNDPVLAAIADTALAKLDKQR